MMRSPTAGPKSPSPNPSVLEGGGGGGSASVIGTSSATGFSAQLDAGANKASAASSSASNGLVRVMRLGLRGAELHLRRHLNGGVGVGVEFLFVEAHRAGDQHVWEGLDARVQIAHRRVVIAPGALQRLL